MRALQRYVVCSEIASGGMAAVFLGKLRSGGGFSRIVAIKAMHAQFSKDDDFRAMFLDEARIVARIRHPNVVSTLDILDEQGELFLVMDYVHGPSLSSALKACARRGETVPEPVAIAIIIETLEGLHAAHEAKSETGTPLGVVHRDVSPQNVLLGADGLARVADFGIATAADRLHLTKPGEIKGKVSYMAPEQLHGSGVDRRSDVYAAGAMLFEVLSGQPAFAGDGFAAVAVKQLTHTPPRLSAFRSRTSPELEAIVERALEKERGARFPTARAMADALGALSVRATTREVAEWVTAACPEFFEKRDALVAAVESEAVRATEGAVSGEAEAAEAPTITAHMAVSQTPTKRTNRILLALLLIGSALGAFALRSRVSRVSASEQAAPVLTQKPQAQSITSVPSSVVATGAAPAESMPVVPVPIAHTTTSRPPPSRPVSTPTTTSSGVQFVLPDCCAGNLRVKLTQCHDNCPSGT